MNLSEKKKHFNKGIELFNSQKFYEAHEEWEKIWLCERGELRNFYQGLIILAGGLHHVQKGRLEVAIKAINKGIIKLTPYLEKQAQLDLSLFVKQTQIFLSDLTETKTAQPYPRIKQPL